MVKFSLVNVVDVEATCYRDRIFPEGETQEIIEIGLAVLDIEKLVIVDRGQIVVRNRLSRVSEFCTELTGWTEAALAERGIEYADACEVLRSKYDSRNRLWISQGNADRRLFEKESKLLGVPWTFSDDHLNMQHLVSLFTRRVRRVGLKKAMRLFGLEFEGRHHSGYDDAYNEARIVIEVLKRGRFRLG
jgi:Inhibitor of the KinA pathway to sporulation, predicted exonuclease